MARTFNHPAWLVGSEEEQAAEAQRQALALAGHGRGHLSEAERLVSRGALLEKTARGNLEAARGKNAEARKLAENQLADALAMGGRFAEAAETHNDATRRKHFRDIVKAIQKPDEEKCGCPDDQLRMNDVDLAVTPRFERAKIFSPVHGDLVSLVECSKCGHLNARPLRSRLLKQNAAMNQSQSVGRTVLSDMQVLAKPTNEPSV